MVDLVPSIKSNRINEVLQRILDAVQRERWDSALQLINSIRPLDQYEREAVRVQLSMFKCVFLFGNSQVAEFETAMRLWLTPFANETDIDGFINNLRAVAVNRPDLETRLRFAGTVLREFKKRLIQAGADMLSAAHGIDSISAFSYGKRENAQQIVIIWLEALLFFGFEDVDDVDAEGETDVSLGSPNRQ